MSERSDIAWTDSTWNTVTGCTKVSPGCAHCYAEAVTLRFRRGGPYLPGLSEVVLHPDRLGYPLSWRAPRRIFVNSMGDLFHEEVSLDFIRQVFDVAAAAHRHVFQVLTKRHERLAELAGLLPWPDNLWVGVSVENQYWALERIPALLQVPAAVLFLSVEPLLRPVDLEPWLPDLQWVIAGGESGPRARPVEPGWLTSLRDGCVAAGVPFFFKQWGGRIHRSGGRELEGRTWDEFPAAWEGTPSKLRFDARRGVEAALSV